MRRRAIAAKYFPSRRSKILRRVQAKNTPVMAGTLPWWLLNASAVVRRPKRLLVIHQHPAAILESLIPRLGGADPSGRSG